MHRLGQNQRVFQFDSAATTQAVAASTITIAAATIAAARTTTTTVAAKTTTTAVAAASAPMPKSATALWPTAVTFTNSTAFSATSGLPLPAKLPKQGDNIRC